MMPRLSGAALLSLALAMPAVPGLAQTTDSKKDDKSVKKTPKKPDLRWQKKENWQPVGRRAGKVLAVNEEDWTIKVRVYGQTPMTTLVRPGNPKS